MISVIITIMGRWYYSNRIEADYLKRIEISRLKKEGLLKNTWTSTVMKWTNKNTGNESSIGLQLSTAPDDRYARIHYTITREDGEKKQMDYRMPLVTTSCHYGGQRYWFICSLSKNGRYCGKRVGVLYMAGDYFGCRHCYDLTYSSRKENRGYKLYYLFRILEVGARVDKIRETMKRLFYAGKPTRKMRRIMRLNRGVSPFVDILRENEKRGII